ncbi:MAG: hypothetical protein ACO3BO_07540, partial [Anaerohalosphaeraceae bacterium]
MRKKRRFFVSSGKLVGFLLFLDVRVGIGACNELPGLIGLNQNGFGGFGLVDEVQAFFAAKDGDGGGQSIGGHGRRGDEANAGQIVGRICGRGVDDVAVFYVVDDK